MQHLNLPSTAPAESTEQGQPLNGTVPREEGSATARWEGYSPDVLAALFDSESPSPTDW
jgi:hypothetical protein